MTGVVPKQLGALLHEGDTRVHVLRDLPPSEVDAIARAHDGLIRYQGAARLIAVAEGNLRALEDFVTDELRAFAGATTTSLKLGVSAPEATRIVVEANRHVINLLSSFRMYLDHAEALVKRACGPRSVEAAAFKRSCSAEYDAMPPVYAFVYRLRNFAQHVGLVVANVILDGSRVHEMPLGSAATRTASLDGGGQFRSLELMFSRDRLLTDFDWPVPVRTYLQGLPEDIEVGSHLVAAVAALRRIHASFLSVIAVDAVSHARLLDAVVQEVRSAFPGADPVIVARDPGAAARYRIQGFLLEEVASLLAHLGATTPQRG